MPRLLALVPALGLAAFAAALGGLETGARFPHGVAGRALLLLAAIAGARELADPLRLGRRAAWLPWVAVAWVAASWQLSALPRAGRVGVLLLPAFLLLPAAVARALAQPAARRAGLAAWSLTVAGIGAWSLAEAWERGLRAAAAPLGRPQLLGAFLAVALPVAVLPARERGVGRAVGVAAALCGGGALVASRSWIAVAGLLAAALVAGWRRRPLRELLLGSTLVFLGLALPRLIALARADDPVAGAARTAVSASLAAAAARPLFGWGPGALAWTFSGFVPATPGAPVRPELALATPVALAHELGFVGFALAAGVLAQFLLARRRERPRAADGALAAAALSGLGAGTVASLGGSWLAVPALPLVFAATAGVALAGGPAATPWRLAPRLATGLAMLYVAAAATLLLPAARAESAYATALAAPDAAPRLAALREAVRLDPQFPLYRARAAWEAVRAPRRAARSAVAAARRAPGLGPLWLQAGVQAFAAREAALALPALERAMALEPLSPAPPYLIFRVSRGRDLDCGARALLAAPQLAAAGWWAGREPLRRQAIERAASWPGLDPEWSRRFRAAALAVAPRPAARGELVFAVDETVASSESLHLFRRPRWRQVLLRLGLDREAARRLRVPPATVYPATAAGAFPPHPCRPGAPAAPPADLPAEEPEGGLEAEAAAEGQAAEATWTIETVEPPEE